jgi:hypothetical protein
MMDHDDTRRCHGVGPHPSDDRIPQTGWIIYAVLGVLLLISAIVLAIRTLAYILGGDYIH